MMPAGLLAGFGVASAGLSERALVTTALIGAGGLSSSAVLEESSGLLADWVSAENCFPGEGVEGLARLPAAGLEVLLSDLVVTSDEALLAGCADFLPME